MNQSTEVWAPIPGYVGLYEASTLGSVRSVDRTDSLGRLKKGCILAPYLGNYPKVTLYANSSRRTWNLHELVLLSFEGDKEPNQEGCHIDGNPLNNELANLRWDSVASNAQDRLAHGRDRNLRKTHCNRGHELTEPNLHAYAMRKGWRTCKSCHLAHQYSKYHDIQITQELADFYYAKVIARA